MSFEIGGIAIVPYLLLNGTWINTVSSEGSSRVVAAYTTPG